MDGLFEVVGDSFFKPLSSKYKQQFISCLNIIYSSYRSELSYGVERSVIVDKLTAYFDSLNLGAIYLDDEDEMLRDARTQASSFLRQLSKCGWLEAEMGSDQIPRLNLPAHAVSMLEALKNISSKKEIEYQSEISAIYSLLTNSELRDKPYPLIIKPVHQHTEALFIGLKQLNTSIKNYIDSSTAGKTAEQIFEEFIKYNKEIGSKAYHRMKTSDNISRFRPVIIGRLRDMLHDPQLIARCAAEYREIENRGDKGTAEDEVSRVINEIVSHFNSYDEIAEEIDKKHSKYLQQAVVRARFLLLSNDSHESKISTILQAWAAEYNSDSQANMNDPADDGVNAMFCLFPQRFVDEASLKTVAVRNRITSVAPLVQPLALSKDERRKRAEQMRIRNQARFSRQNVFAFVATLLERCPEILASELPIASRRDAVRIVMIRLFGRLRQASYAVIPQQREVCVNGFSFNDFLIKKKDGK
ncbi:hypothetical protein IJT17_08910 [bacterium]|nr:hypothetical protein [bacterium]